MQFSNELYQRQVRVSHQIPHFSSFKKHNFGLEFTFFQTTLSKEISSLIGCAGLLSSFWKENPIIHLKSKSDFSNAFYYEESDKQCNIGKFPYHKIGLIPSKEVTHEDGIHILQGCQVEG